jgi:hypothetical protein
MVRPVTVSQSNAVVITNKNASPTGRLKRRLGLAELLACGQTLGSRPFSYRPVPPPIAGGNREREGAKRMLHLDRIQRCRQYSSRWGSVNDGRAKTLAVSSVYPYHQD